MGWKTQINDRGQVTQYRDSDTGETLTPKEFERRQQMGQLQMATTQPALTAMPAGGGYGGYAPQGATGGGMGAFAGAGTMGSGAVYGQNANSPMSGMQSQLMQSQMGAAQQAAGEQMGGAQQVMGQLAQMGQQSQMGAGMQGSAVPSGYVPAAGPNPLIQPGARMLSGAGSPDMLNQSAPAAPPAGMGASNLNSLSSAMSPTAGESSQSKSLRLEGVPGHGSSTTGLAPYKNHGFLDATSIAVLLPTSFCWL